MRCYLAILCVYLIYGLCETAGASYEPIWISPTNVNLSTPADILENYSAKKGVWSTIDVGAGSRGNGPIMAMDSKGILWIMFGTNYRIGSVNEAYLFNVWNYNPKTDQYRYVWGSNETAVNDPVSQNPRDQGGISPTLTNHPGGSMWSANTIDNNDNIWFMSFEHKSELWMFNTTSLMFLRIQGLDTITNSPNFGPDPGQPSVYVQPGNADGACLVADSQNNLWLIGGQGINGVMTTVWHLNTTSSFWTWIYGSPDVQLRTHDATFYGGTWGPGCFIDENDRVWLYGGIGAHSTMDYNDYGSIWTFDTRVKRQYELEYGPDTFKIQSVVVSDDYHPDNHPGASHSSLFVDRLDGTAMLVLSAVNVEFNVWGSTDQIWLYNKTSKLWKLAYGNISAIDVEGEYINYRQPGSKFPCVTGFAVTNTKSFNGDVYIVGGSSGAAAVGLPNRKDIWFIPNDQCASASANKCSVNAQCIEEMFGYSCVCNDGFTGDGFTCNAPPIAEAPITNVVPIAAPTRKTSGASAVAVSFLVLATIVL